MPSVLKEKEPYCAPAKNLQGGQAEWVDTQRAAKFLGVKVSWLYNAGDKYGVPVAKLGNQRRYNLAELDQFMRSGGCK